MIDIYAPEGAFAPQNVAELLRQIGEAFLRWTDATEIPFVRRNAGVYFHLMAPAYVTAAGQPDIVVRMNVTVPAVVLSTIERRRGLIEDTTRIVNALSHESHATDRTWVTIVNAADGGWGLEGHAFTNAELDDI